MGAAWVTMAWEKRRTKRKATIMLVAGPTAYTRMRFFLEVVRSASSSGSTNAPMGTTAKIRPNALIAIFPTRVSMPWANSCTTMATMRPNIPYQMGMSGLIPGIPSNITGDGADSAGMFGTKVTSQTSRANMENMATKTMTRLIPA